MRAGVGVGYSVYRIIYRSYYRGFNWPQQDCQRPKQSLSNRAQSTHTHTHIHSALRLPLHQHPVMCADTHLHHLVPVHAQQQRRLGPSPWPGSRASFGPSWRRCCRELRKAVTESHREGEREGDPNEEARVRQESEVRLRFVVVRVTWCLPSLSLFV